MRKSVIYRHGDVVLHKLARVPKGATKEQAVGRVVLAEGEVTGHAHVLSGAALEMWELGNRLFVDVAREPATLDHQEHGPMVIETGVYEVTIQRVYTPEEIRRVVD